MKTETKIINSIQLGLLLLMIISSSQVSARDPAKIIAGYVENIKIETQDYNIKAKLDTGARTSSIHGINIEPFKKDGERWLKFTLLLIDSKGDKHELLLEKPRSRRTNVKNHDGEHDKRYVVDLEICFNNQKYLTEFTLADRNQYIYDVLLGRQFLNKIAVIDPEEIFLTSTKNCN